jgi:uncharacterized protein YkwD
MGKFEEEYRKKMVIAKAPRFTINIAAAVVLTLIAWTLIDGSVVDKAYATHLLANRNVLVSNLSEQPEEKQIASKIHELVNQERQKNGLEQLSYDDGLASIAKGHSQDMAENNYFSHRSSDGSSAGDRILQDDDCLRSDGSYYYGENIWSKKGNLGSSSDIARSAFDSWMDSPGHRQNILNNDFAIEGIGAVIEFGDRSYYDRVYITQDFC